MTRLVSTPSAFYVVIVQCVMLVFVEGQLWRLLITPAVGPAFWAEERTDEGKLLNLESRQLGGFYDREPPRRLRRVLVESDVVVTTRIADDGRWLRGRFGQTWGLEVRSLG